MLTHIICLTKGNLYYDRGGLYTVSLEGGSVKVYTNPIRSMIGGFTVKTNAPDDYYEVYDNKIAEAYAEAVEQGKLTWDDVPSEWRPTFDPNPEQLKEAAQARGEYPANERLSEFEAYKQNAEAVDATLRAELAAAKANQITPRDFFAGCALNGLLSNGFLLVDAMGDCWDAADAMMAERDKEEVK